ncbi:MAG: hypothetical protein WA700_02255 [Acidobacteriaceae bacterium]
MSTDPQDRADSPDPKGPSEVSPRRLWFGFVATAIAWTAVGCLDVVFVWVCKPQGDFGVTLAHPVARILFGLLAVALLIVSIYSGIVSYRNWQRLSVRQAFFDAQAVERHEFLAVLGVIITLTLGMGLVWFALPTIFLDLCWRAR